VELIYLDGGGMDKRQGVVRDLQCAQQQTKRTAAQQSHQVGHRHDNDLDGRPGDLGSFQGGIDRDTFELAQRRLFHALLDRGHHVWGGDDGAGNAGGSGGGN
jgi:hypothetical protein